MPLRTAGRATGYVDHKDMPAGGRFNTLSIDSLTLFKHHRNPLDLCNIWGQSPINHLGERLFV